MANGFLDTTPASRHGEADDYWWEDHSLAQRHTVPGSGPQTIEEIGAWVLQHAAGADHRFALFTDDPGNACPEAMVANSETPTLDATASWAKSSHTYDPQPEVTGGVDFWIGMLCMQDIRVSHIASSGENSLSMDLGAWPDGDDWHSATSEPEHDWSLYAVYVAGGETYLEILLDALNLKDSSKRSFSFKKLLSDTVSLVASIEKSLVFIGVILEQEGFRFRDDDDSEAAAAWLAAQDVDITRAKETNTRLRILLNTTGDQDAKQFKLQYKKTSEGTWRDMPVSQ